MGTITSQIDAIIAQRKSNISRIENILSKLQPCMDNVNKLVAFQERLKNDPDAKKIFDNNQAMVDQVVEISVEKLRGLYQEYYDELMRLQRRFERNSLHISFIGSAGMGKSLVMQNISGLDGDIIPSARGGDCTGARSIITNSDIKDILAEIEFYSEYELVEHVNKYLDDIFLGKQGKPLVRSIFDLKRLNYDDIKKNLTTADSRAKELLEHLRKYFEHVDEYAQDLGHKITVPKEDIEKYVAQYKSEDFNFKYYHYLGVKTANILCKFPYEDAGKIVLLDTIGIGTTSLGTEEQMFETIRNDSDAIVWMFRPDSERPLISATELDIMEKVQRQVGHKYTSNMMFCVINQVSGGPGENAGYCVGLQNDMRKREWPLADVLTLNCKDKTNVRNELLMPILNQLSAKLVDMDNLLLDQASIKGQELYEEYNCLCTSIENALVMASGDEFTTYLETSNLVEDVVEEKIEGVLRNKSNYYYDLAKQECGIFKEACEKVLRKMMKSYPSKEIINKYTKSGKNSQGTIMELCTNITRYNILQAFLNLDLTLDELVKNMKIDIVHVLADADGANLGALIPFDGKDPDLWLDNFMKELSKSDKYYLIYNALSGLREFRISVKGYLLPVVRYELRDEKNGLDWQERDQKTIPAIESSLSDTENFVDEVQDIIKSILYDLKDNIEKKFEKYEIYRMPYKALFAASRDMYDRSTFSANEDNGTIKKSDADKQWKLLYKDKNYRATLWRKEYEEYSGTAQVADEWNKIREDFTNVNEVNNFIVK